MICKPNMINLIGVNYLINVNWVVNYDGETNRAIQVRVSAAEKIS